MTLQIQGLAFSYSSLLITQSTARTKYSWLRNPFVPDRLPPADNGLGAQRCTCTEVYVRTQRCKYQTPGRSAYLSASHSVCVDPLVLKATAVKGRALVSKGDTGMAEVSHPRRTEPCRVNDFSSALRLAPSPPPALDAFSGGGMRAQVSPA